MRMKKFYLLLLIGLFATTVYAKKKRVCSHQTRL